MLCFAVVGHSPHRDVVVGSVEVGGVAAPPSTFTTFSGCCCFFRDEVGEALGCSVFVSGIALLATGLILNWQLGLVMLACVPFIGISVATLSSLMSSSTQEGNDHYSKAGGVATEVCATLPGVVCACSMFLLGVQ